MRFYVYTVSDPMTGEVRYVGMTARLKMRKGQHLNGRGCSEPQKAWWETLRSKGLCPVFSVIHTHSTSREAQESESSEIALHLSRGCRLFNRDTVSHYPDGILDMVSISIRIPKEIYLKAKRSAKKEFLKLNPYIVRAIVAANQNGDSR